MINLIESYSKRQTQIPDEKPTSKSQQAKANNNSNLETTTRISKHKMSSNSALTMAVLMKEAIADMPDTLDTKKEVEEYFKAAMKVINEKKKEEEKVKKAAAKAAEKAAKPATKKRGEKKEKEVDEEGNEIVKEKKPLSRYMKFMEEHRPKVAANVSGLTPQELFTEVAKLWKTYKDFLSDYNGDDEERKAEIWETKLEELLVKRNEELNADKEEVKEDADEEVEEVEEKEEAAVVAEKKKGGKKKAEEVEEKKEKKSKTVKPAKPVEVAKKPKMKGGKKKAEESDVEKKESEDEENSS